jgi:pyridoxal 5'-phosphate synthase / NAD(P)H-hydrate epimerase
VSLTAPKLCAKKFTGPHHFLGGRFVPPPILNKYGLKLPPYHGTSMCVRIGKAPSVDISSLRENYISPELLESQVMPDPFDQVWSTGRNFENIHFSSWRNLILLTNVSFICV